MPKRSSKIGLILLLVAVAAVLGLVADQVARAAVDSAVSAAQNVDPSRIYLFSVTLMTTFLLLATLPVLMLVAYRGLNGCLLSMEVGASLRLCALGDDELQRRIDEFEERNGISAFFLPSMVNLIMLYLIWYSVLLPSGIVPVILELRSAGDHSVSLPKLFASLGGQLSPLTWALLGGYFYVLSSLIRRWMLSDLTTNLMWRIDVRLVLTFILGLLLIALGGATGGDGLGAWTAGLAFLVGVVPDLFLRWLSQQVKRLVGIDALEAGLFAPSDLQRKIPGMSFWQAERLAEEGIESVQDLARKDIPSLLIKTRFDAPLLLHWVDRSLLCAEADRDLERFAQLHLYTATDVVLAATRPNGNEALAWGLNAGTHPGPSSAAANAAAGGAHPTGSWDAARVQNILNGLSNGPNLRHLLMYRHNFGTAMTAMPNAPSTNPEAGAACSDGCAGAGWAHARPEAVAPLTPGATAKAAAELGARIPALSSRPINAG